MGILDPVCVASDTSGLYALAFGSSSMAPSSTFAVLARSDPAAESTNSTALSWTFVSATSKTARLTESRVQDTVFDCLIKNHADFFILARNGPLTKIGYTRGLKYQLKASGWKDLTYTELIQWSTSPMVVESPWTTKGVISITDNFMSLNTPVHLIKSFKDRNLKRDSQNSSFGLTMTQAQTYTIGSLQGDPSGLSAGAIVGIVLGSLVGLVGLIYCCFFRRQISERNTQKMMDHVNNMHAQEPQGEISSEVLPDGSVGLTVRPLPNAPVSTQMLPNGVIMPVYPPGSHPQQPQRFQQQLIYTQGQRQFSAAPIALAGHSSQHLQQQLRLSTHPRPGVVTIVNDSGGGGEVKGDDQTEPWKPSPFVPPTATPIVEAPITALYSRSVFRAPDCGLEDGPVSGPGSNSLATTSFSSSSVLPGRSKLATQRQPQDYTPSVSDGSSNGSFSGPTLLGIYSNSNSYSSINYSIDSNCVGGTGRHVPGASTINSSSTHYNDLDFSQLVPKTVHNPHESIPNRHHHQHGP
ncbi:hypothetical protein BGZ83_009428 [Gryganskiella cystojenkinii]|nr:hypothetical protein BGZ83_009428 [Gryganskiella cystojenkinii]